MEELQLFVCGTTRRGRTRALPSCLFMGYRTIIWKISPRILFQKKSEPAVTTWHCFGLLSMMVSQYKVLYRCQTGQEIQEDTSVVILPQQQWRVLRLNPPSRFLMPNSGCQAFVISVFWRPEPATLHSHYLTWPEREISALTNITLTLKKQYIIIVFSCLSELRRDNLGPILFPLTFPLFPL